MAAVNANTSGGNYNSISLTGTAPAIATGSNEAAAMASIGQAAPTFPAGSENAVALATASPQAADVDSATAGDPVVTGSGINAGDTMALVLLGGAYGGSGASETYSSDAFFSFNPLTSGTLEIGFLNTQSAGIGFDSLTFNILLNGATVDTETFDTLAAAQLYFEDQVVGLGEISADTTLEFQFDLTSANINDEFATEFAVANVPEPGTWTMLLMGTAGLGLVYRQKRKP